MKRQECRFPEERFSGSPKRQECRFPEEGLSGSPKRQECRFPEERFSGMPKRQECRFPERRLPVGEATLLSLTLLEDRPRLDRVVTLDVANDVVEMPLIPNKGIPRLLLPDNAMRATRTVEFAG